MAEKKDTGAGEHDLATRYAALDELGTAEVQDEGAIRSECLIAFVYEYADAPAEVAIDTDEFTALCPWTAQPDFGTMRLRYLPGARLLELKSFKYYLLSFRSVGIVQEHVAGRVVADLARLLEPRWLELELDYKSRGGLHTVVKARHPNDAEG